MLVEVELFYIKRKNFKNYEDYIYVLKEYLELEYKNKVCVIREVETSDSIILNDIYPFFTISLNFIKVIFYKNNLYFYDENVSKNLLPPVFCIVKNGIDTNMITKLWTSNIVTNLAPFDYNYFKNDIITNSKKNKKNNLYESKINYVDIISTHNVKFEELFNLLLCDLNSSKIIYDYLTMKDYKIIFNDDITSITNKQFISLENNNIYYNYVRCSVNDNNTLILTSDFAKIYQK